MILCKTATYRKKNIMEEKKNLYPIRFIPVAERKPWGGDALIKKLGKEFTECDNDGNEVRLSEKDRIGESWEISDMGFIDSVVENGWLAGNTFGELMDTYIERIAGEDVYQFYGRQFPVLVKFLDIQGRTSLLVHPDDEVAGQRYDSLGKCKMWYVMEASDDARIYMGFRHGISAQEFYDRCIDGSVVEDLNTVRPHKGDWMLIRPGTVHAAEGGLLIAEVSESSDLDFSLCGWEGGKDTASACPVHLEEAFDFIDLEKYDSAGCPAEGSGDRSSHPGGEVTEELVSIPQFTVSKITVHDPLSISNAHSGSFIIYIGINGEADIQVPDASRDGSRRTESYRLKKGSALLVPADMPDFFIVPLERDTELLEVRMDRREEADSYINPDTEPYLEGEDYGGIETTTI